MSAGGILQKHADNQVALTEYRLAVGPLCFTVNATSEAEAKATAQTELKTLTTGTPITLTPKLTNAVLYPTNTLKHDTLKLHNQLEVHLEFPEPPQ